MFSSGFSGSLAPVAVIIAKFALIFVLGFVLDLVQKKLIQKAFAAGSLHRAAGHDEDTDARYQLISEVSAKVATVYLGHRHAHGPRRA